MEPMSIIVGLLVLGVGGYLIHRHMKKEYHTGVSCDHAHASDVSAANNLNTISNPYVTDPYIPTSSNATVKTETMPATNEKSTDAPKAKKARSKKNSETKPKTTRSRKQKQ